MLDVALFEDENWVNFQPLSSTRHVAQQILGTAPLFEHVAGLAAGAGLSFLGREYLKDAVKLKTKLGYNELGPATLLVNARLNPLAGPARWTRLRAGSALIDRGEVVAAAVRKREVEGMTGTDGTLTRKGLTSLAKGLERLDSPDPVLFEYPWEVLEANGAAITAAAQGSRKKLIVSEDADIEEFVSFDLREGPVIVEDRARVEAFSRISGPCYIAREATLHSCLVRGGTTVGEASKVGGEVDHSILYQYSNKAHFGYLGHSIVGEWVNVGAGAVTSDLKNTYGNVRVLRRGKKVDTGLLKFGAMFGDMAKVSIGSMVYGGRTLGVAARCSGIVEADVPDFCSYDGTSTEVSKLALEPVLLTQERMGARRGKVLIPQERKLISHIYSHPAKDTT